MKNSDNHMPLLLGVYAMNNVNLVDKPFSVLNNDVNNLGNRAIPYLNQTPLGPQVVKAVVPNALAIQRLGVTATAADLAATIFFDTIGLKGAVQKQIGVMGFLVTQRFRQNTVTNPYQLEMKAYAQLGSGLNPPVIFDDLSRSIQVEPTGGANSATEFLVLVVTPGYLFNYNPAPAVQAYDDVSSQNLGYASILTMAVEDNAVNQALGLTQAVGLIFKDQAGIDQATTVTPLIIDSDFERKTLPVLINVILKQQGINNQQAPK